MPSERDRRVATFLLLTVALAGPVLVALNSRTHICTATAAPWLGDALRSRGSLGSIASLGSLGSILSIGSVGSVLSIASTGSVLSIGSFGGITTFMSLFSLVSFGGFATVGYRGAPYGLGQAADAVRRSRSKKRS